jgi:hypothetical protein
LAGSAVMGDFSQKQHADCDDIGAMKRKWQVFTGGGELKRRIKNFRGRFKLDFTEAYLNRLSEDRLRHILLAALINARPWN